MVETDVNSGPVILCSCQVHGEGGSRSRAPEPGQVWGEHRDTQRPKTKATLLHESNLYCLNTSLEAEAERGTGGEREKDRRKAARRPWRDSSVPFFFFLVKTSMKGKRGGMREESSKNKQQ